MAVSVPTVPAAAPARPASTNMASDGRLDIEAGLMALLAAAGLAGAGLLLALSRRKRREQSVEESLGAPAVASEPAFVTEPALERFVKPAAAVSRSTPAAAPESAGDARKALLERMVAAPPDEANPYVSRKRRVRRARMILAQREQRREARPSEAFDWRTYRSEGAKSAPPVEAERDVPVPYPT